MRSGVRHHVAERKARLGLAGGKPPQQVRPATRVHSGWAKAGVRFVGAVVALQLETQQRAMTHNTRALQLLFQAIRTVDSFGGRRAIDRRRGNLAG